MARETLLALETARLLAKHRAFSAVAAQGILRGLALELIATAYDPDQMLHVWQQLDTEERLMPEVAIVASSRLLKLGGDMALSRLWVLPVWEQMLLDANHVTHTQRVNLIRVLETGFAQATESPDGGWLDRIEKAQMANPGDAALQYLAGITCMRLQLWGKAQQLLKQALPRLQDAGLERSAWQGLAELAEQRGDAVMAAQAWQKAAKTGLVD
jgi:HemY protein